MKSTTLILLLLLLSTITWIQGQEEKDKCNTCSNTIVLGRTKEEPRQSLPPKTACNHNEYIRVFGMILCNYDGCCEHCLKHSPAYHSTLTGSCLSVSEMRYIPELVQMLEKQKRTEEEFDMFLKDNEPEWLFC